MSGQAKQTPGGKPEEAGEVRGAPPFSAFAEAGGGNAVNADAAPRLCLGKLRLRVVVSAPAGNDRNLVAALNQTQSHLGQILPGGHDVRVKGLVEQEEGHNQ